MRLFAVVAALFIAGGVAFAVAGALGVSNAIDTGTFRSDFWSAEFWLLVPGNAAAGLGTNGKWLLEGVAGGVLISTGTLILRVSGR